MQPLGDALKTEARQLGTKPMGPPGGGDDGDESGGGDDHGSSHHHGAGPMLEGPRLQPTQFKLKVADPDKINGKKPKLSIWLTDMARWIRLTGIPNDRLWDYVATRVEGAASIWVNSRIKKAQTARRMP